MSLYGYNLVYNCTKSSHEIGFDSVLSVGTVPKSSRNNVESGKNRYRKRKYTRPLTFLAWYKHFNKKWRSETSFVGQNV